MASAFQGDAFQSNAFESGGAVTASLSAAAVLLGTAAGSFSANATVMGSVGGSFTADATWTSSHTGSFTADAALLSTISGSVSADAYAVIRGSGSFSADAVVLLRATGSVATDAVKQRTGQGSLTARSVFATPRTASFTASAEIVFRITASLSADAIRLRTISGSVSAAAAIFGTTTGSISADSYIIFSRVYGSFTADAIILRTIQSNWNELVVRGGAPSLWFRLNESNVPFWNYGTIANNTTTSTVAIVFDQPGYVDDSVYYNGLQYARTDSYSLPVGNVLTMEAWVYPTSATRMTILGCNNVSGVIQLEISATQQVSAIVNTIFIATSTAGDVTLNAWNHIVYTRSGTGAGTHKIYVNGTLRTLTANSASNFADNSSFKFLGARTTTSQRFIGYLDEVLVYPRVLSQDEVTAHYRFRVAFEARATIRSTIDRSFTSNARVKRNQTGSFSADAVVILGGSVTSDAVKQATLSGAFTQNAAFRYVVNSSFTTQAWIPWYFKADAAIFGGRTGTFTAKARFTESLFRSFTADAVMVPMFRADAAILRNQSGSISSDADITSYARVVRSVTADAHVTGSVSRSFTADAVRSVPNTGSFSAAAQIRGGSSLAADAAIQRTVAGSLGAYAWIYSPRTDPPQPNQTPLVSIVVDGIDITADVMLSTANFTMAVNGAPGAFQMQVRDSGHDWNFVSGSEITMDIDGRRKFGGYVTLVSRGYAFPVDDTTVPATVDRFWTLSGVDYNILFTSRLIYKKSDPANVSLREWPAGTQDDVIIRYIFDNYTDLAADNANCDGVQHVGHPNPDRKGVVGSGGLTFGDAMREVNRLIGAVWYFDQHKTLHFVDVDQLDSFVGLSDRPGAGQVGYRELEHNTAGTALANDALVWGTGKGSDDLTFSRSQDSTSIGLHGRWQYGEFTSTLYKQASVDLRASTVVNGTPQSLRGAKNDKRSWSVTTYEPSFAVGQRVEIESEVFGLSEVVPIRKMTITFPTKKTPQFQLVLTHEIDEPWNMYEFYFPKFSFNYRVPRIDTKIDEPCQQIIEPGGTCDEAICGITDTFTRYVSGGWGTSDAGVAWNSSSIFGTASVEGTYGKMYVPVGNWEYMYQWISSPSLPQSFDITFDIEFSSVELEASADYVAMTLDGSAVQSAWVYENVLSAKHLRLYSEGVGSTSMVWAAGSGWYHARWQQVAGGSQKIKFWTGESEPVSWTLEQDVSTQNAGTFTDFFFDLAVTTDTVPFEIHIDNLNIPSLTRCTGGNFDNFNRTVSGGWGTSSSGSVYTPLFGPAHGSSLSVDGSSGKVTVASGGLPGNGSGAGLYSGTTLPSVYPFTIKTRTKCSNISLSGYPGYGSFIGADTADGGWSVDARIRLGGTGGYSTLELEEFQNVEPYGENSDGSSFDISGVSIGSWINIEMEFASGLIRMRWYVDGGTPSAWNEMTTTNDYVGGRLFASAVSFGPTFIAWWDYINIDYDGSPCYSDCSAGSGTVDNFNRVVSNDWGVSDLGIEWYRNFLSTPLDVDGSYATFTVPDSAQVYHSQPYLYDVGPVATPWTAQPLVTMTCRFKVSAVYSSSSNYTGLYFYFLRVSSDDYAYAGFEIDNDYGFAMAEGGSWDDNYYVKTDWVANTWYLCKIEMEAGVAIKVKVWEEGGTEPGWQTSSSDVGFGPLVAGDTNLIVDLWGRGASTLYIDYISFGEGCLHDVATVIDDWDNRTVALQSAEASDSVLGPISSGTGDVWVNGGQWYSDPTSDVWMGVENGTARVRLTNHGTGPTQTVSAYFGMTDGYSSFGPWAMQGHGVPDYLFTGTELTWSIDFMVDSVTQYSAMQVALESNWDGGDFADLWMEDDHYDFGGLGTYTTKAFSWQANTWYRIKQRVVGSSYSIKIWDRSQTEPSAWSTEDIIPMPWHHDAEWSAEYGIMVRSSGSAGSYTNCYFDNFVRYTTESGHVYPADGSSVIDCGGMNSSVATARQKVFQLPDSFIPNSTRVWVNGLFQRPGYEYTEQPKAGTITFARAMSGGELVHIEYVFDEAL